MSDFLKVLNERTSAEHFDSATPISVQEIKELISEACQAPSSFNIQHWRFIAVTDERINPVQVMEILSISDHYAPVMMLAVGRPASVNNARSHGFPSTRFSRSTSHLSEHGAGTPELGHLVWRIK